MYGFLWYGGLVMLREAEYQKRNALNLAKIDRYSYAVFQDGEQIGSVCRIWPSGWYFTFKGNKLPFVGSTRMEAIKAYLTASSKEVQE